MFPPVYLYNRILCNKGIKCDICCGTVRFTLYFECVKTNFTHSVAKRFLNLARKMIYVDDMSADRNFFFV